MSKDTLQLPKTAFSMKASLPLKEPEILKKWEKNKIFENPKLAILNFTGPGMYTKVMRDYLSKCNKNDYKELDTKFNGNGIFKLNGSQVRYHKEPSYTYLKNKKICL